MSEPAASPTTPDRARTEGGPGVTLVRAAMAGDRVALRALWEEHRRWVAAVVLAHKPRSADLDDLLQEVAVTLIAKIGTLEDPAAFPGWLRMVALNAARLAGRKTSTGPRITTFTGLGAGTEGEGGNGPAGGAVAGGDGGAAGGAAGGAVRDEARRVFELAMRLPPEYREPLLLRTVQELSYQQISAITGLPETTIETRIARGRRMLRELAAEQASAQRPSARVAARAFAVVP